MTAPDADHGLSHQVMVVFDWNGTIVLDRDRARESLNATLREFRLTELNDVEFGQRFRLPFSELFAELGVAPSELTRAESLWNAGMLTDAAPARPGTAALERLAADGTWLGVVSAAEAGSVAFDMESLGMPPIWREVRTSVVDKRSVLDELAVERPLRFYVGDTAYDMRCARAAGFVAVGVTGGYADEHTLRAAGAEHLIADLTDLLEVVASAEVGVGR